MNPSCRLPCLVAEGASEKAAVEQRMEGPPMSGVEGEVSLEEVVSPSCISPMLSASPPMSVHHLDV